MNCIDSGLQRTWLVDAPCWGLCPHFCGDGLLCREGTQMLYILPKNTFNISRYSLHKVVWFRFYSWQFRTTLLALGHFLTQSGGGSWLSLLSGEAINDIVAVFVLFTMKNQDVIFSFHGILHLQIWWHRSSVVCRKSYGRTLRSLWHFHSHPSSANRC